MKYSMKKNRLQFILSVFENRRYGEDPFGLLLAVSDSAGIIGK